MRLLLACVLAVGCARPPDLAFPHEVHLRNVHRLTDGGENAEAYFSPDGRSFVFQSTRGELTADQIFTMGTDGSGVRMVSTGAGRTTCGYWYPDGSRLLYATTHLAAAAPPPPPDRSRGYVWGVTATYDIVAAAPDGSGIRRLTTADGYDAEATIAPDASRIVFTSSRDGDLELYDMRLDGSSQRRLTRSPGYDGGAFYSPDSKLICFRARVIADPKEQAEYDALLADGLVKPSKMEIFVMNADGTGRRAVTAHGAANFCPFFTPDGKRLIFSSNMHDPNGRPPNFDLYLINVDGTGLKRVTFYEGFDGFPMFSPDGKKLVFCSNRHGSKPNETNIMIADWVE